MACGYVEVSRWRGQQLKDVAQLDPWLRDGSAAEFDDVMEGRPCSIMIRMTRRDFAAALPAATALAQNAAAPALTARQVIDKIRENLGVAWREPTVDTIKAGNPDAPVRGIATTVMATLDVLQRAAAQGKNLIITHEPTFYNHEDKTQDFEKDPVYLAKRALIAQEQSGDFPFP